MGSAIILYDCRSDAATFSGGSWLAELPLINLADPRLSRVARSTNLSPASTKVRVVMPETLVYPFFVLGTANMTPTYSYRVKGYASEAFSYLAIDTGWIRPDDPEWEDPEFWFGTTLWEPDERVKWLIHRFPTPVETRCWEIEIDDQGNPDGYLDLTRMFLGRYVQPSFNYSYSGNALAFEFNALVQPLLSGGERVLERTNPRTWQGQWNYLPETDLFDRWYRLFQRTGRGGEVFIIPDPDDTRHMHRQSFLGRIVQPGSITQSIPVRGDVRLQVKEII